MGEESLGEGAGQALARFSDGLAMPILLEALEKGNEPAPVAAHLKARTGQDFGADAALWRAWWQARPK